MAAKQPRAGGVVAWPGRVRELFGSTFVNFVTSGGGYYNALDTLRTQRSLEHNRTATLEHINVLRQFASHTREKKLRHETVPHGARWMVTNPSARLGINPPWVAGFRRRLRHATQ